MFKFFTDCKQKRKKTFTALVNWNLFYAFHGTVAGKTSIYVRSSLQCRAALIGLQLSLQRNCRIGSCSSVDLTVTKASSFKIHNLGNEFGANVLASWPHPRRNHGGVTHRSLLAQPQFSSVVESRLR